MAHAPASEMTVGPERRSFWRQIQAFMLPRPGLARLGVIVLLFGIWEIAARFYVDKMFLSPPSNVFTSLQNVLMTNGVPAALPEPVPEQHRDPERRILLENRVSSPFPKPRGVR